MKKGFTLIELLAVIVILAIIALIATPIVLNIINDTKKSAILRSAEFYIDAVENEITLENMKTGGSFNPNVCTITNGIVSCDGKELTLKVDGEVPISGSITYEDGKVKDVNLTYKSGTVTLNNNGELVLGELQEQRLAPGLYDENDNLIESWDELEKKYNIKNAIESSVEILGEPPIMSHILSNYDNESKLVIDDSITFIGGAAFFECKSLTSIIIGNGVKSISSYAFYGCTGLTEVIIGENVTSIGNNAFQDSINLTTITIPDSVTSIGDEAFMGCTSLKEVTIPSSVRSTGNMSFSGCTNLTEVMIENGVESIGGMSFCGCGALTQVTIPSSVISIENYAFAESGLTEVVIPHGVESIGDDVFNGCKSLTSITIPDSLTYISPLAFYNCPSLTSIYYKGTLTSEDNWGSPNASVKG